MLRVYARMLQLISAVSRSTVTVIGLTLGWQLTSSDAYEKCSDVGKRGANCYDCWLHNLLMKCNGPHN